MSDTPHLLVVDDEEDLREIIDDYFSIHGFTTHVATNGDEMRDVLAGHPVDVVLLDLRMPGEDGFQLCRYLRDNHDLGVIMLTGSSDMIDKVVGLEMGADDYVAKPFDLRELLARVKSVIRRVQTRSGGREPKAAKPADPRHGDGITIGECRLNTRSRTLHNRAGEMLPLTSMEFDLLKAFVDHPDRVLTRDQLLDIAHGRDREPLDRSIDIRVTRLRKKIERDPSRPRIIRTVRGEGYLFSTAGD